MTQLLDAATRRGWIGPGTARTLKVAGVPVLLVCVLVWLVVVVLRAGGAGPPAAYAEFVDTSGRSYLDVQLNSAAKSYGWFAAVLPGHGRVSPVDPVDVSRRDAGTLELRYDGVGHRDRYVQPGGYDEPRPPRPKPQVVRLRLVAQIDPARHVASVDVWVDGERHRIASAGQVRGAEEVVRTFLTAMRTRNWDLLYSIEARSMRNGIGRSEFVTLLANGGAVTTVSDAQAVGSLTYGTSRSGASVARVPIRVTYGTGPETTSVDAVLVVAVDGGTWKVLAVE